MEIEELFLEANGFSSRGFDEDDFEIIGNIKDWKRYVPTEFRHNWKILSERD
ncbi:hypothetical protein [Flagellimonas beolgyonensis]|uniref:hypothetical protein n=1 Tax=Flagellimonas beolgyonensis TaxID=864064 RepID=UPI0013E0BA3D|nr:hypothetical protein [Allomuricauda beolgyonensis]